MVLPDMSYNVSPEGQRISYQGVLSYKLSVCKGNARCFVYIFQNQVSHSPDHFRFHALTQYQVKKDQNILLM